MLRLSLYYFGKMGSCGGDCLVREASEPLRVANRSLGGASNQFFPLLRVKRSRYLLRCHLARDLS